MVTVNRLSGLGSVTTLQPCAPIHDEIYNKTHARARDTETSTAQHITSPHRHRSYCSPDTRRRAIVGWVIATATAGTCVHGAIPATAVVQAGTPVQGAVPWPAPTVGRAQQGLRAAARGVWHHQHGHDKQHEAGAWHDGTEVAATTRPSSSTHMAPQPSAQPNNGCTRGSFTTATQPQPQWQLQQRRNTHNHSHSHSATAADTTTAPGPHNNTATHA